MAKPTRRQRHKQRHRRQKNTEHDFNKSLKEIESVLQKRFHAGDPEAIAFVNRLAQLAQLPQSQRAKFIARVKNELLDFATTVTAKVIRGELPPIPPV